MIFYDFEVFREDWLVVLIDPKEPLPYVVINDAKQLERIYERYKNDIWIGFNSRHYDQWILKAILCGFDPWEMNEWIITRDLPGWQFSSLLRKIFLINYDVMPLNSSLKQLEGFQGHNIHESEVDFRIKRKLTQNEITETVHYCTNDVKECMNVFAETINDFTALLGLVKEFDFPISYMSKTKAQISAEILECEPVERNDEWELFTLPCLKLSKTRKLTVKRKKKQGQDAYEDTDKVLGNVFLRPDEWFLTNKYQDYRLYFETEVCGVKHQFGWGGLHGALEKYHYKCDKDHLIIHVDVASYYPSLMIFWNLLTRNAKKPWLFKQIYDKRLALKAQGKKKEQAPLKIVLNGTYGICKDKNNKAYDPRNANLICVNGQLLLLDLLEKLDTIPSFELIQSNTDGLIIKIHRRDFERVDDICYEWEQRTKMNLEFDFIEEIWQKDVNNYVFKEFAKKTPDGKVKQKIERKGAYVKELSNIDNDLPIINKAMVDYMLKGITPEQTINSCDRLVDFQKICKLTKKFDCVYHNGKHYYNKCYRIFASKRDSDQTVYKLKVKNDGTYQSHKFANTSEHSFIENGDITNAPVPHYLDRQWYIDLTYKRLRQYGVKV